MHRNFDSVLFYINPDVWDTTNYAYLPSTQTILLNERKILGVLALDIRDPSHSEYVQIVPTSADNPVMWIIKYSGYYGSDPNSVLNEEYIFNRNIVVYYQATSYTSDPGPTIYRHTNPPVNPNPSQNDAFSGGDAGNSFNNATTIDLGHTWVYSAILTQKIQAIGISFTLRKARP